MRGWQARQPLAKDLWGFTNRLHATANTGESCSIHADTCADPRRSPRPGRSCGAYMCSNTGVKPAGVVVVAQEGLMLNHVSGVVHSGADFTPDFDLLQGHHHCPDGALPAGTLGKQVPKLHSSTYVGTTMQQCHAGGACMSMQMCVVQVL